MSAGQQQPSAPATPSSHRPASFVAADESSNAPQEGLNGSNVPGLPPSNTSVPTSRRTSGMPDDMTAGDQIHLAAVSANRRSMNGSLNDIAASFERMGLSSAAAQQAAQTPPSGPKDASGTASGGGQHQAGQSPLRASPAPGSTGPVRIPPSSTPSPGGVFGPSTAANGQHTLLQRAMNRTTLDGQQQPPNRHQNALQHVQQSQQNSDANLTPVFNERFLFSDDELEADDSTFVKKYNLNEDDNSFPVLIRHESQPGMLSASSAALDLAPLAQTPPRFPRGDANASEWPQFAHRDGVESIGSLGEGNAAHGSMVGGSESFDRFNARRGRSERNSPRMSAGGANNGSNAGARGSQLTTAPVTPVSMGRSVDVGLTHSGSGGAHFGPSGVPGRGHNGHGSGLPGQGGFHSTHDRSIDDGPRKDQLARAGHSQDSQQGRVPKGIEANSGTSSFAPFAMGGGFSGDVKRNNGGALPASAGRFGPSYSGFDNRGPGGDSTGRNSSAYFDAFAAPPVNKASGAQKGVMGGGAASADSFGLATGGGGGDHAGTAGTQAGLNGLKMQQQQQQQQQQQRKGELDTSTPLEDLQGEIFALCKDQHGCRYLQKKLEEGNPSYRDMIFTETFSHFAELMTDPFGNYLCQKMLEYCTDEQRNLIVESVAPDLVGISLNMHGTRAVQKTIDFLSTPRQIHSIIMALGMNVVPLIKDLNGNHVVQKCLNRLNSSDNQFIYDAVAAHCVEVATHRHGCCVLQRCIDHASDKQRMQLVQEITYHALTLVQDPFGNYVVQYILDLNDSRYSEALVRQFVGHVCNLSVQKFSSNVIEKCIRVSDPSVRKLLIEELLNRTRLEKLLRDSFANYVVQTSLDYADPVQRMQLVECIKPTLPMIRNTPYGKRIQSKLQRDNIDLGPSPGNMPYGMMHQAAAHQQQMHAMAAMVHRQGSGGGEFGPSMHHPQGPYGGGNNAGGGASAGNYMPGGNQRTFSGRGGQGGMGHIPPQAMYGGGGAGGGNPGAGNIGAGRGGNAGGFINGGFGASSTGGGGNGNGNNSNGGAAAFGVGTQSSPSGGTGFGRPPPHHGGAAMGYGGQQAYGANAAAAGSMQNGFSAGPHPGSAASAFHGQGPYGTQF